MKITYVFVTSIAVFISFSLNMLVVANAFILLIQTVNNRSSLYINPCGVDICNHNPPTIMIM